MTLPTLRVSSRATLAQATIIDAQDKKSWQLAARFASVGLWMGSCVAIGLGIGWWLDGKLGTEPWLLLTGLLFGIAAAFKVLLTSARAASRELR
ncbi:MAG: AtpZ/AtpI family protein [Myxococcota bacterium]